MLAMPGEMGTCLLSSLIPITEWLTGVIPGLVEKSRRFSSEDNFLLTTLQCSPFLPLSQQLGRIENNLLITQHSTMAHFGKKRPNFRRIFSWNIQNLTYEPHPAHVHGDRVQEDPDPLGGRQLREQLVVAEILTIKC